MMELLLWMISNSTIVLRVGFELCNRTRGLFIWENVFPVSEKTFDSPNNFVQFIWNGFPGKAWNKCTEISPINKRDLGAR